MDVVVLLYRVGKSDHGRIECIHDNYDIKTPRKR